MDDVFIGSEALASDLLSRGQLRWRHRAIYPDVYIRKEMTPSLSHRALGAWLWSGREAVVSGLTAAALHGAQGVDESADVELIWRNGRPPRGIAVRRVRLESDEITEIAGVVVTRPERTAFDLARYHPRDVAVACLDALSSATGITASAVAPLVERYRGSRHCVRAVNALSLMDGGSQSPAETRVRLALIDAGFPAPKTRFVVADATESAVIAMGYDAPMVGLEFNAVTPEVIVRKGWTMIRVGDGANGKVVAHLVKAAVIELGYPLWKLRRIAG